MADLMKLVAAFVAIGLSGCADEPKRSPSGREHNLHYVNCVEGRDETVCARVEERPRKFRDADATAHIQAKDHCPKCPGWSEIAFPPK